MCDQKTESNEPTPGSQLSQSPTAQEILHHKVRSLYPQLAEHEWFLISDGSGHKDGYTGSSCIVFNPEQHFCDIRAAGFIGSTTERGEFEALLLGLQAVVDWCDQYVRGGVVSAKRPLVHWLSDRESLVLAVARDEGGDTIYQRKSTPDLWRRFSYYEDMFKITPEYLPRDTNGWHRVTDIAAGDMRDLMKTYGAGWELSMKWMNGWEDAWSDREQFIAHVQETCGYMRQGADAWENYQKSIAKHTTNRPYADLINAIAAKMLVGQPINRTVKGYILPH